MSNLDIPLPSSSKSPKKRLFRLNRSGLGPSDSDRREDDRSRSRSSSAKDDISPPAKRVKEEEEEDEEKKKRMEEMVEEVFKEFLTQKLTSIEKDQHKSKLKSLKKQAQMEDDDMPNLSDEVLSEKGKSPKHKKHKKDKDKKKEKKDKKKDKKKEKDEEKGKDKDMEKRKDNDKRQDQEREREKDAVEEREKVVARTIELESKFSRGKLEGTSHDRSSPASARGSDKSHKKKHKEKKKKKKKSKEKEKGRSGSKGHSDREICKSRDSDNSWESADSDREKSPEILGYNEFKKNRIRLEEQGDSRDEGIPGLDTIKRVVTVSDGNTRSVDQGLKMTVSVDNKSTTNLPKSPKREPVDLDNITIPGIPSKTIVSRGNSIKVSLTDIQLPPTPDKQPTLPDKNVVDLNEIALPKQEVKMEPLVPKIEKDISEVFVKVEPESVKVEPSTSSSRKHSSDSNDSKEIEEKEKEDESAKAKKAPLKLGIKISQTSAAFIQSGIRLNRDGAEIEDGEVEDSDNDKKASESQDSMADFSDEESSKKSKKHKHKKKSHHSDKSHKKDKSKERETRSRSKSPKRRHRSRSRSESRSESKSESRSVFDRKRGIWRSRSRSKEREKKKSRSRSRSRDRHHRRDRDGGRDGGRDRDRERDRERHRRSRSRSPLRRPRPTYKDFGWRPQRIPRSPERSSSKEDLRFKIDKAKLREIAIANAYANMASGNGPMVNLKPEELAALKAGGKSVAELTDFCKNLARKEGEDPSSSDEEGEIHLPATDDDQPFINHPFKVRDASSIVLNIRNAKQLPVLTPADKLAQVNNLRLQFPVSSGSQHRHKELEWVPVQKTTAPPTPTTSTPPVVAKATSQPAPPATPGAPLALMPPPPPPPLPSAPPPVAKEDRVFPEPPDKDINIGAVVSERLTALRKLQENPHDVEAMKCIFNAQKQMDSWAQSKQLPGQFLGSTGATVLKPEELSGVNKKHQAWAKKDSFTKAEPLKPGIGMFLLQKMGWKQGEGLGKNKEGTTVPLMLDIKMDRKGLTSTEEFVKKKNWLPTVAPGPPLPIPAKGSMNFMSDKHPVSALVELCTKRRWGSPNFIVVNENGPDHQKKFLFKVRVNGMEYQPAVASTNKKTAKAEAAACCLMEMGLLPKR